MANETEPGKLLLPYLQRADELQKHEPLVAYYCRLYAMERGLKIPQGERTKTTNSLLISLMNQLEKDKKSLKLGPEDNLYVEGFALNVFAKADKQDRAGRADLNTAKTFYAASIFFEILNQFGVPQPDLEQKQKYAVWKAADIRKAVKEGRKPTPGPPSGDDDLSIPSTGAYDKGPSEPTTSTNPRNEPDPSQFYDSTINHHSTNAPPPANFPDNTNDQHSTNIPPSFQYHDHKANDHHSTNAPPPAIFHDNANDQHSTNIPPSFQYHDNANDHHSTSPPPHHFHDETNHQLSTNLPSVPQNFSTTSFASHDFPPPPGARPETSDYSQPYQRHQSFGQDPQQHFPHNYPPDSSAYSLPHFQSYPSFSESTLPAVLPHFSPYYQGSDTSYTPATQSAPPATTSHQPTAQFWPSIGRNGSVVSEPPASPAPAKAFEYDCNYLPPPEKLAEAQKAARFAVGALAFDDVPVAVDFLRKSLELLTNPSAGAGQ